MDTLLKCASTPIVGVVSETVDLPQVQAMNMLKVLFRSTRSGSAILQFAAKGMTLAISSLASPHWSIRNAATLLYGEVIGKTLPTVYMYCSLHRPTLLHVGALVLRMLGHRVVVDEQGRQNSLAVHEFFARYPSLEPFLLGHVRQGVGLVKGGAGGMCPSVHPTLLLLSKLAPPTTPGGCSSVPLCLPPLVSSLLPSCVCCPGSILLGRSTGSALNSWLGPVSTAYAQWLRQLWLLLSRKVSCERE